MRGIQLKPIPSCPLCGARMVLRKPKSNDSWDPFWGCSQYPDCDETVDIGEDGKPELDDDF